MYFVDQDTITNLYGFSIYFFHFAYFHILTKLRHLVHAYHKGEHLRLLEKSPSQALKYENIDAIYTWLQGAYLVMTILSLLTF